MDCQTARQAFEALRADSGDVVDLGNVADPELARVAAHLERCPECRNEWKLQQQFDREFGRVCRDVPIPPGLATRLRVALELSSPATVAAVHTAEPLPQAETAVRRPARRIGRRRSWIIAAAAAAVVAGLGLWLGLGFAALPQVQVAKILEQVTQPNFQAASAPAVHEAAAPLPDARQMFTPANLQNAAPHSLILSASGRAVGALYDFSLRTRHGDATALLVVLDRSQVQVQDPPAATSFATAPVQYRNRAAVKVWGTSACVYICLIRTEDPDALNLLLPRVHAT